MKNSQFSKSSLAKIQQIIPSNDDIIRERCKRSLSYFIKQAWPILEGETPYLHGWHIDAMCLPYDSLIMTIDGQKKIGDIVTKKWNGLVYSYNHSKKEIELKSIKHWFKNPPRDSVRLITSNNILTLTKNHPIFIIGKGYVPASQVNIGDKCVELSKLQNRFYKKSDNKRNVLFQDLPLQSSKEKDPRRKINTMQILREVFLSKPIAIKRWILFSQMLWKKQNTSVKNMYNLRENTNARKSKIMPPVLYVGAIIKKSRKTHTLLQLWSYGVSVCSKMGGNLTKTWSVLRVKMPRYFCNWKKQCKLYRWVGSRGLSSGVSKNAEAGNKKRWAYMFFMYAEMPFRCASRRQKSTKQRHFKFSIIVQKVSWLLSWRWSRRIFNVSQSTIISIERDIWISDETYNIEVDSNNNYFADNILLHNCEHLMAVTRGEIKRLLINIPPGTMKSLMVSVFWPAWEWSAAGLPHYRIVSASHGQDLAIRDNLKTRRLIESEWYQNLWPLALSKDQNAKLNFQNGSNGFRQACAVKSMTGLRGDRIIWDDPHTVEGSHSQAERETTIRVFKETLPTRLISPKESAIVIMMQRVHEDDVSGYILKNDLGYEHLMLPMEFEPSRKCYTSIGFQDPRTTEGELLFPERFPIEVVERDKKVMGSHATAGQFQQRPAPLGGGMFKEIWWGYFDLLPKIKYSIIIADTAQKTKEQNDYSVFQLWGLGEDKNAYLIDSLRGKWEAPQLLTNFVAFWNKCKANQNYKLRNAAIEDKSSGTGLIQTLKQTYKIPLKAIQRDTRDKVSRAFSIVPYVEAGYVFLPKNAPWLSDFLTETSAFPNAGSHDDQVDCLSDGLDQLLNTNKEFNIRVI